MRGYEACGLPLLPEPDLPWITIAPEWVEAVKSTIPKVVIAVGHAIPRSSACLPMTAMVLTLTKEMSDFFQGNRSRRADPKQASNWLIREVNSAKTTLSGTQLTPHNLAQMIRLIESGTISSKIAKHLQDSGY